MTYPIDFTKHLTIHYVKMLQDGVAFFFQKPFSYWVVHLTPQNPRIIHGSIPLPLEDLDLATHPLNHYLKGGVISAFTFEGDVLNVIVKTIGFGSLNMVIGLRKHHPVLKLFKDEKTYFSLNTTQYDTVQIHKNPMINDAQQAFDRVLLSAMYPLQKLLRQRIRTMKNKQKAYASDREKHQKNLVFRSLAEHLQTLQHLDILSLRATFGTLLDYERFSFGELLNYAYLKYKSAKHGLEKIQENEQENRAQLKTYTTIDATTQQPTLDHYYTLKNFLVQEKILRAKSIQHRVVEANSPYQIQHLDWTVSFGKNQKQNDYLTFTLAKKQHVFLHLDGRPSHHVILHMSTFDLPGIRFASEVLLRLNNQEDGSIVYAKVGSLKRTSQLGQVMMRDVKKIFVKISHQFPLDDLIKKAIRL